MTEKNE